MKVGVTLKSTVINRARIRLYQVIAGATGRNNKTNHTETVGCAICTAIEKSGSGRKHARPTGNRNGVSRSVPVNGRLLRGHQLPILKRI